MTWDELAAKFRGNVATNADEVLDLVARLEKQPDLRAVTQPLLG
jgi:hypothetical protein